MNLETLRSKQAAILQSLNRMNPILSGSQWETDRLAALAEVVASIRAEEAAQD